MPTIESAEGGIPNAFVGLVDNVGLGDDGKKLRGRGLWHGRRRRLAVALSRLNLQRMEADTDEFVGVAKMMLKLAKFVLPATGVPMSISKGSTDTDQLFEALVPFLPLADLVASQVTQGVVTVPLVIFADDLEPPILVERFKQLLALAKPLNEFGPKLNFQSIGRAVLYPLLIYFDPGKHGAAQNALLAFGFQARFWARTQLRVGFVSVSDGAVSWAEITGAIGVATSVRQFFGEHDVDGFGFGSSELERVKIIADRIAAASALDGDAQK